MHKHKDHWDAGIYHKRATLYFNIDDMVGNSRYMLV